MLLILEYPHHHQNLISSSLYYPKPLHTISSQSIYNFLSNVVHKQTNKQADKPTLPKTYLLCLGGNYVLESHVKESSMESFMRNHFRS